MEKINKFYILFSNPYCGQKTWAGRSQWQRFEHRHKNTREQGMCSYLNEGFKAFVGRGNQPSFYVNAQDWVKRVNSLFLWLTLRFDMVRWWSTLLKDSTPQRTAGADPFLSLCGWMKYGAASDCTESQLV